MPEDPLAGYDLTPAERERMLAHIAGGGDVGSWQRGDRPPARQTYGDRIGWEDMSPEERRALGLVDEESQYKDADYWWKQWWRQNTAEGRADRSRYANEPQRTPPGGWQNIQGGGGGVAPVPAVAPAGTDGTLGGLAGGWMGGAVSRAGLTAGLPPSLTPSPEQNPFDWGTGDAPPGGWMGGAASRAGLSPKPITQPGPEEYWRYPGVPNSPAPDRFDPRRRGTLAGMLQGQYY